jgi:large subunit ribosomal protein L5
MTRLNDLYTQSIRPDLIKEAGYANVLQVPKLEKIVINMGIGEAVQDSKKSRGSGLRTVFDNWTKTNNNEG